MDATLARVRADEARARTLGWDVTDGGRLYAMQENAPDLYLLSLFGGMDDGHRVTVHLTYRESVRTGVFLFSHAEFTWPEDQVITVVRAQGRTWARVTAYAPRKEADDASMA